MIWVILIGGCLRAVLVILIGIHPLRSEDTGEAVATEIIRQGWATVWMLVLKMRAILRRKRPVFEG